MKRKKKYLFEENALQKYIVDRSKARRAMAVPEQVKCQEKHFIQTNAMKVIEAEKINDKILEMDSEDVVDLSYYKQLCKYHSLYHLVSKNSRPNDKDIQDNNKETNLQK